MAERSTVRPGEPFEVGLHMKMKAGWHTYWKNPGDAGVPLRIEWSLPAGFTANPIEWSTPERIRTGQLMSYGYGREVLFPVTITPPAGLTAESVTIAGTFEWIECKDACVPGAAPLSLTIPVRPEPTEPGPDASLFARARVRRPRPPEGWGLSATAGARAIELLFRPPPGARPRGAYLFVDQPLVVEHAAVQGFERAGDGFRLTMTPAENAPSPPRRITGVLVLDGVGRADANAIAVNVEAAPGDPAPAPPQAEPGPPLSLYAAIVALIGAFAIVLRRRARRS